MGVVDTLFGAVAFEFEMEPSVKREGLSAVHFRNRTSGSVVGGIVLEVALMQGIVHDNRARRNRVNGNEASRLRCARERCLNEQALRILRSQGEGSSSRTGLDDIAGQMNRESVYSVFETLLYQVHDEVSLRRRLWTYDRIGSGKEFVASPKSFDHGFKSP